MKTSILILVFLIHPVLSWGKSESFDKDLVLKNAFTVIEKVVAESHPEFHPNSVKDIQILRFERNGIIDFTYVSKDGRFRGDVFCEFSQLIKFNEKYSNVNDTCFRANVYEHDETGLNGFGKQVGIY